jgi:flagellar biosynthesis/type III secretory pathway protein FliH
MIRRSEVEGAARGALVLNLGDIARDGERVVALARAEAERIVAEARAERDRLIADAHEQGHAEGLARGMEEGRAAGAEEGRRSAHESHAAALARIQGAWEQSVNEFERARVEMLSALRRDALALAMMLAERVVRRVVDMDEEVVVRQLEGALSMLARETRVVVAVHPDDEAVVRAAMPKLVARFADAVHAELAPDPTVGRGGCAVRTHGGGVIDATIRTQIERMAGAIGVDARRDVAGAMSEGVDKAGEKRAAIESGGAKDKRSAA